jgi:hypothetical protein
MASNPMSKKLNPGQLHTLAVGTAKFSIWGVLTGDSIDDVLAEGYLDLVANIVEPFDRIEVTCDMSGEPKHLQLVVTALVSPNAGTVRKRLVDWQPEAAKAGLSLTPVFNRVVAVPMVHYQPVPAAPARRAA